MAAAADFAFRQAFALCPSIPGVVFRYIRFLTAQNRVEDEILVAQTASEMPGLKESQVACSQPGSKTQRPPPSAQNDRA